MTKENETTLLFQKNKKYRNCLTVAVTGFARSGKNSLCSLIESLCVEKNLGVKTFSFAYALKKDLDSFCKEHFNISSFSEKEEKSIIRPILIAYGESQRKITNGTYWWKKVMSDINDFYDSGGSVALVSDLRFKEFEHDEIDFVKSYANSLTFCVQRVLSNGEFLQAVHDSESRNSARLINCSDAVVKWDTVGNNFAAMKHQSENALKLVKQAIQKIFPQ